MAVKNKKNNLRESVALVPALPQYAGYADCFARTAVNFSVTNGSSESLELKVCAESPEGAIVPYESTVEGGKGWKATPNGWRSSCVRALTTARACSTRRGKN